MNSQKTKYEHIYIAIDLKSFYASVECRERGLNPLTTNLVVADSSRTEKTICLAVSPSLKQYGIPGRARLFEVVQKVREINYDRRKKAYRFTHKAFNDLELKNNKKKKQDELYNTFEGDTEKIVKSFDDILEENNKENKNEDKIINI